MILETHTSSAKQIINSNPIDTLFEIPLSEKLINLKKLSDEKLTEYLGILFSKEKQIGDSILMVLKEIKSRRIFAALGYSSLFEMLVKHFHLSETSSYQRLNALKLMESVPTAAKEIFNGNLSLTNAAAVQSYIFRSEKEQKKPMPLNEKTDLITAVKNKSTKEAHQILAAINPAAIVPKQKEKIITDQITQLQILVDQKTLAQLKQVQSLLSHKIPDGDYNQILKLMTAEMIVILQKRKGIYNAETENNNNNNNNNPNKKSYDKNFNILPINQAINSEESPMIIENSAQKIRSFSSKMDVFPNLINASQPMAKISVTSAEFLTPMPEKQSVEFPVTKDQYENLILTKNQNSFNNNTDNTTQLQIKKTNKYTRVFSRYISDKTKKSIFAKANNRCQYVGRNGHRCNSQHQLEIDHIKPISHGGNNEKNNLQILCRAHNQYKTKQTHGFWFSKNR